MKYLHLTAAAAVLASSTYAIGFTATVSMDNMSLEKAADTALAGLLDVDGIATAGDEIAAPTAATVKKNADGSGAAVNVTNTTIRVQNSASGNHIPGGGQDRTLTKTKVSKFVTGFGVVVDQDLGGATFAATVKINSGKIKEHTQHVDYAQFLPVTQTTVSFADTEGAAQLNSLQLTSVAGSFADIATTYAPKYTLGIGTNMKIGGFSVGAGVDFMRVETTVAGKVREQNNNSAAKNDFEFSTDKQTKNVNLIKVEMNNAISDKLSMSFNYKFGKLKSQTFAWKTDPTAATGPQTIAAHGVAGYITKDRDIQSYGIGMNFKVM